MFLPGRGTWLTCKFVIACVWPGSAKVQRSEEPLQDGYAEACWMWDTAAVNVVRTCEFLTNYQVKVEKSLEVGPGEEGRLSEWLEANDVLGLKPSGERGR